MDIARNCSHARTRNSARRTRSPPRRTLASSLCRLRRRSTTPLGSGWYAEHGNKADRAAFVLCRLRRARGGQWKSSEVGDDAVRAALGEASPEAVVWLASRAISYMDENGFPEAAEPYIEELALALPEQDAERKHREGEEVRREREARLPHALRHRRPARRARPHAGGHVVELALVEDRGAGQLREPVEVGLALRGWAGTGARAARG